MTIQKARKYQHKLRVGLSGPTGSGKTYTALKLAKAIADKEGGRIGLVDTEHGTASLYADEFDFDVLELKSFAPDRYVDAIAEFEREGGYTVLIVDSLTHAWAGKDGALEQVDRRANGAGGSFNAWRDVTPQHNRLVEALLSSKFHLIGTLRSKMAYEVDTDPKTKKVTVRKLGLQPIQREGMEYEFDVFADLDVDNTLTISKTRNKELSGYSVQKAGEELGLKLWEWASGGDEAPAEETGAAEIADQQAATAQRVANGRAEAQRQQSNGAKPDVWTTNQAFIAELTGVGLSTGQLAEVVKERSSQGGVDIAAWRKANPGIGPKALVAKVAEYVRSKEEAEAEGLAAESQAAQEAREEGQAALLEGSPA